MDNIKINKKGRGTLTGIVISLIITLGIFSGMFLFLQQKGVEGSITLDIKYNETYTRLNTAQTTLDNNINEIKDNLKDIGEADSTYQVAWNGLKGLGNVLLLPISFVSSAIDTTSALIIPLDIIPTQYKNLIIMGIIALVVFIVLAILKGEPKM